MTANPSTTFPGDAGYTVTSWLMEHTQVHIRGTLHDPNLPFQPFGNIWLLRSWILDRHLAFGVLLVYAKVGAKVGYRKVKIK